MGDAADDPGEPAGSQSVVEVVSGSADAPTVVVAAGQFDDSGVHLGLALDEAVAAGDGRVLVDLTATFFIDSSVIRALLRAQAKAVRRGGWLRVAWTDPMITRVFTVCGLNENFPQYPTVAAAVRDRPVAVAGPELI